MTSRPSTGVITRTTNPIESVFSTVWLLPEVIRGEVLIDSVKQEKPAA